MDETKARRTHTLCWNCAHATHPDVCPWVDNFTPVPGWEATPTLLMQDSVQPYESYLITACPLFERDACRGGLKKAKKRYERHELLDEVDVTILEAYAENGMNVTRTAKNSHFDRRTVSNRLTNIRLRVGIDPREFHGLGKLLEIIKGKGGNDGLLH